MIPVLTKQQAYKLDKDTIESGHFTQEQLMDNAGKAVAQFFCEKIKDPFNQKVVIVCGKGNNGGDGVITHTYLKKYNVSSLIVFIEEKHGHSKLIKKYKISKSDYSIYNHNTKFEKYDWIIDAIFGIGFSRTLIDKYLNIVNHMNSNNKIISIDNPSGFSPDGNQFKYAVNSNHVVALGYPKLGHYLNPINGLLIKNIGFNKINKSLFKLVEYNDILKIIKSYYNKKDIHKYTKGTVCINGGSPKYPGAAILAARASLKSGAGYVNLYIYHHNNSSKSTFNNLIASIKSSYPDIILHINGFINGHFDEKNKPIPEYNNVLFGPGINNKEDDNSLSGLEQAKNFVIDAGGFQSFPDISAYHHKKAILTPHLGEFKKIFNLKNDVIIDIALLKSIQNKIENKIIILKLFNTFIITKDIIYIMDRGPSILATAGTGDVLSGILVSLLSQGYSRHEASILGTYLHAEAANYYIDIISKDGMTASDLIECIPHAFNKLRKHNVN